MGAPAKPNILKKYTKELFRRYDDRTAELTQIVREKEGIQRKVDSLKAHAATLEAEIKAQDHLLAQLTAAKRELSPPAVQALMESVHKKLMKVLKSQKP